MSTEELIIFVKKNAIFVACAAVSIAIGVVLYYRSDQLPDAEKVLADKAQQGELLAANIEDSNQLKEQYAELAASNQAINDRMIRVGQLAENLQYFYKLESDTGTKLTDLRQNPRTAPGKGAPKTAYVPVGFSITVQGQYPQILDVLRRLENGEHYFRILTCSLRPTSELRGGPLTASINLELLGVE